MFRLAFQILRFGFFVLFGYHLILLLSFIFIPQGYIKNIGAIYSNTGFINEKLNDLRLKNNLDILFVGSSITYRGINPNIFIKKGKNSFNIGTSNQTPKNSYLILKMIIEDEIKIKQLFLEVSPLTISSDGIESLVDIISHTPKFNKNFLELVYKFKSIKVYNALIYSLLKFKFGIKNIWEEKTIEYSNKGDYYFENGFVANFDTCKNDLHDSLALELDNILIEQLGYIDSIKNLCDYNNIRFNVISLPNLLCFEPNIDYLEFNNYLNSKFNYFNYKDSLELATEFYLDNVHLNKVGADSFTNYILNKSYLIK